MNDNPQYKRRATINPYRNALHQILTRLRWDLDINSWKSRRRLKALKESESGRKCVIMCNGPSLLNSDLSLLQGSGIYTIGLNKINLLFEKHTIRPSSIVAVNRHVVEQNRDFFNETGLQIFISRFAKDIIQPRDNVIFVDLAEQPKFARDVSISLQQGFTVTFVALQVAFHLGFKDVALIGCDHNFKAKGNANTTVKADGPDCNHFDPRYFSDGVNWQLPDLLGSEHYYDLARRAYEAFDRRIVNCTIGGKLEVFPRISLEDWIGE